MLKGFHKTFNSTHITCPRALNNGNLKKIIASSTAIPAITLKPYVTVG